MKGDYKSDTKNKTKPMQPCMRCGELVVTKHFKSDDVIVCGHCQKILGPKPTYATKNCDECGLAWAIPKYHQCENCFAAENQNSECF